MATRAPKGAARPNSASAGRSGQGGGSARNARTGSSTATRTTTSRTSSGKAGSRTGANRSSSSRGGRSRRNTTPYYRRRSAPAPRRRSLASTMRASRNPLLILVGWLLAGVAALWMELARAVRHIGRLFGDSARDLDPAHRRDGAGLGVLAAAFVTAGAAWWGFGSGFGHALTALIRGTFGIAAWTLPILLGLLAWRLLRHPDNNAHTGRMVIGWTTFLI